MSDIIRCLLLPIQNHKLILPCSTVAEIIPYEMPEAVNNAPEWLIGLMVWQNQQVPLICVENMELVQNEIKIANKAQVAILNRISDRQKYPFIAFLLQGIPKLVRFSRPEIEMVATSLEPQYMEEAKLKNETVIIPNLNWIFEKIESLPMLKPVLEKLGP